jgi:bacteriorhodopsin
MILSLILHIFHVVHVPFSIMFYAFQNFGLSRFFRCSFRAQHRIMYTLIQSRGGEYLSVFASLPLLLSTMSRLASMSARTAVTVVCIAILALSLVSQAVC